MYYLLWMHTWMVNLHRFHKQFIPNKAEQSCHPPPPPPPPNTHPEMGGPSQHIWCTKTFVQIVVVKVTNYLTSCTKMTREDSINGKQMHTKGNNEVQSNQRIVKETHPISYQFGTTEATRFVAFRHKISPVECQRILKSLLLSEYKYIHAHFICTRSNY